jgi:hypothetical protein
LGSRGCRQSCIPARRHVVILSRPEKHVNERVRSGSQVNIRNLFLHNLVLPWVA